VYWALIEKQTWIVTINTAPVSLFLLHMTNVNFSLYVEAVAMSRGSGGSLIAETNQDHSIHTPHKHKQCHLVQVLLHTYPKEILLNLTYTHICAYRYVLFLQIILHRNFTNTKMTQIFNCRKCFVC
jgi:hypothetical protein